MINIHNSGLNGSIKIVSSKSLSHRYVIAASLAEGKSVITNILESDDLVATKKGLISLGATINGNEIIGSKVVKKADVIDAFESGSTLRFLIPISMLQDEQITFVGHNKLPDRPNKVYEDAFKGLYTFNRPIDKWLPLDVKGPLKAGTYNLEGNVSSQFITGLLYALPLLENDSKIVLTTELESKGYVDLTLDVIRKFGVNIDFKDNQYLIKGNQKYIPQNTSVEGDFSGAAFFVVAGILNGSLRLEGLNINSLQGDKEILDIAIKMGADITITNDYIDVKTKKTNGIVIDLAQIPDLGPILMVLGALSNGVTKIINASRLRIKESDRLDAMVTNLRKMGAVIEVDGDDVTIYGKDELEGGVLVSSYKDHRIAMSLAVAALKCKKPITLDDESVVSKSYPKFFLEFERLGGIIK